MNILLTGSNGFVGSEIKNLFINNSNHFLILPIKKKIKNLNSKRYKYFRCNLEKPIKCNLNVDIIIHCASKTRKILNNKRKKIYDPNILMTKNLIKFANKKRVKKIFFFSTMMVYKKINQKKNMVTEKDHFNLDLYAKSKLDSEKLLCSEKNLFKSICIRLPGVLTISKDDGPLLKKITFKLLKNEKINIYNSGQKFNNLTDSYEIFKLIKFLSRKTYNNSIYNLGSTNPIKFNKLIEFIKENLKSKSKIKLINSKIKSFQISTHKIENELNYKPSSTKKIITRFCKSIKKLEI